LIVLQQQSLNLFIAIFFISIGRPPNQLSQKYIDVIRTSFPPSCSFFFFVATRARQRVLRYPVVPTGDRGSP